MISFARRFLDLAKARSPLCLGVDPSTDLLQAWGLPPNAGGVRRFCDSVMEAAADRVAVIKPQAAFFEQFGPPGMQELARLVGLIRERGALALIDGKRADVALTMDGYARAMLGAESGFGGDAMTVVAYLGFGSILPVLERAARCGGAAFVVVCSSNPDGSALQQAQLADGRRVADALADDITAFNAAQDEAIGPAGAVMGATITAAMATALARLPRSLLLAPGVGAQGASFADVARHFGAAARRALPSVSRRVLACGPAVDDLRRAIDECRDEAFRMVEAVADEG
jgi:orotidine-5'-phosphate decarboxylase